MSSGGERRAAGSSPPRTYLPTCRRPSPADLLQPFMAFDPFQSVPQQTTVASVLADALRRPFKPMLTTGRDFRTTATEAPGRTGRGAASTRPLTLHQLRVSTLFQFCCACFANEKEMDICPYCHMNQSNDLGILEAASC